MKKGMIILGVCVTLCLMFVLVVHYIEKKQQNWKVQSSRTVSADNLQDIYGDGIEFEKILKEEDFGKIKELDVQTYDNNYFFADDRIIEGTRDIFNECKYYKGGFEPNKDSVMLWSIRLIGSKDIVLRIIAYSVEKSEDVIGVLFFVENLGEGMPAELSDKWSDMKMYVSVDLSEKFVKYMEENIENMSLELAKEKIEGWNKELPLTDFLNYKHEKKEHYTDYGNEDDYMVYHQELSDYDGYLKIYALEKTWSGADGAGRKYYIFKIELYDNAGNKQEDLYSDIERYEQDKG